MSESEKKPSGAGAKSSAERSFRKGNINFDFLQPEEKRISFARGDAAARDRRDADREGKRGLFNRGRPQRPIGSAAVFAWATTGILCLALAVGIVFLGDSVIWLLALPVSIAGALWSVIMLALFKARPR